MATQTLPNLNVVPSGYRWTTAAAQKAADKRSFIHVGGQQTKSRSLSGAKRHWQSGNLAEQNLIYNTTYRITGTPDDVLTALVYAGFGEAEAREAVRNSITKDNFETTKVVDYNNEIGARDAMKGTKPANDGGYDWATIVQLARMIGDAKIVSKTGERKGAVVTAGRGGTGETLGEKVAKLTPGKVIDVSNMDVNTGKGIRTVNAPKTAKSGKFSSDRIPIISNDIGKYVAALRLVYGASAETDYAADIKIVRDALSRMGLPAQVGGLNFARVPSPARPEILRQPSPPRLALSPGRAVPGATLASPVTFQVPGTRSPRGLTTLGATQGLVNLPGLRR